MYSKKRYYGGFIHDRSVNDRQNCDSPFKFIERISDRQYVSWYVVLWGLARLDPDISSFYPNRMPHDCWPWIL